MSQANRLFLLLPLLLLVSGCQRLIATQGAKPAVPVSPAAVQVSAPGVDAAEPVTASAPDGSFYLAWVNHDAKQADVMIANFGSNGEMRGAPVRVNRTAGVATAWRGDQPSLAVAEDGSVYVVWTARVDAGGKHGTDVYMSVSSDRAQSFTTEVKINDDRIPGAHGMHSLAIAKDGRVYVGWLDERNIQKPKPSANEGHHMESNRDLFIAHSTDGGRTFSTNRKIASEACPCCKTALAVANDGTLYAGWRQVLPGSYRHIAIMSSTDGGANFSSPVIVSDDRWMLQGCPVSGPSLSVDASGRLKVLWYAAGEANAPGLYFTESTDKGRSFSARQLLAQESVKGTPALTAINNGTIAVWQNSSVAEAKTSELGKAGSTLSVAANAELPVGAASGGKLFVAYIARQNEKRSVWLVKAN